MRVQSKTLFLSSLLFMLLAFTTAIALEANETYIERPLHVKYWPEDPPTRRRDLEAIQFHIDKGHAPKTIKKMSVLESEKFFPEYWGFGEDPTQTTLLDRRWELLHEPSEELSKESPEVASRREQGQALLSFRPPFAVHEVSHSPLAGRPEVSMESPSRSQNGARAASKALQALQDLEERDFTCVVGTDACTSIGYPNSCCTTGETCVQITDTGLGPVGCCPAGATCVGGITACSAGASPCPAALGGGCCISGYVCSGVGCIANVMVTITSTIVLSSLTSVQVLTSTVVSSQSALTSTAIQTTLVCSASYTACPINLGGGCCPPNRMCTTGLLCPLSPGSSDPTIFTPTLLVTSTATVSTVTVLPPVRPTSAGPGTSGGVTTAVTPIITGGTCPTGFYACSAYYNGGCCRFGQDCQPTDCPSTANVTVVSSGVTIVVPAGQVATTTAQGVCPSAWTSCPAGVGGSCCPGGWLCGVESCTSVSTGAAATVTGTIDKLGLVSGAEHNILLGSYSLLLAIVACLAVCLL